MVGPVTGQTRQSLLQFQQTDQCQSLPSGFYVSLVGDEDLLTWASADAACLGMVEFCFAFPGLGFGERRAKRMRKADETTRALHDRRMTFICGGLKRQGGLFICGGVYSRYPGAGSGRSSRSKLGFPRITGLGVSWWCFAGAQWLRRMRKLSGKNRSRNQAGCRW